MYVQRRARAVGTVQSQLCKCMAIWRLGVWVVKCGWLRAHPAPSSHLIRGPPPAVSCVGVACMPMWPRWTRLRPFRLLGDAPLSSTTFCQVYSMKVKPFILCKFFFFIPPWLPRNGRRCLRVHVNTVKPLLSHTPSVNGISMGYEGLWHMW